jgi:hypothetical protein
MNSMNMADFIQALNIKFTEAERADCLPLIGELAEIYRGGQPALQAAAEREQDVFFKTALELAAYDGGNAEQDEELLRTLIIADRNEPGVLRKPVIMQGIVSILQHKPLYWTECGMYALLGTQYLCRFMDDSDKDCTELVQAFLESAKDIDYPEHFDDLNNSHDADVNILGFLDSMAIQYTLAEVDFDDLLTIFKCGDCVKEVYKAVLANLPNALRYRLLTELERVPVPTPNEAEAAKSRIFQTIIRLESEGVLEISRRCSR